MSKHVKLQVGDLCICEKPAPNDFDSTRTIKYRYVVADALDLGKRRGEKLLVPAYRLIRRKKNHCNVDDPGRPVKPPRICWIEREKLRKLPTP